MFPDLDSQGQSINDMRFRLERELEPFTDNLPITIRTSNAATWILKAGPRSCRLRSESNFRRVMITFLTRSPLLNCQHS